ncbi:MAG: glycosyl hydrolase [marine benthic group bacterium]|nr:glycosyl hydrolase [Candidatus Benthicola marisminoris]
MRPTVAVGTQNYLDDPTSLHGGVTMNTRVSTLLLSLLLLVPTALPAQDSGDEENGVGDRPALDASLLAGLEFRAIGPALTSGRIGDLAVHPDDPATWYVAVSSGGVWKTVNAGVTWKPIFDSYGSYSIGTVTVDPRDPLVVWVGTGENNSQRSVGYGDGLYKSVDGGRSFDRVGLEESEHIAKILIDPRDSDVVFVAAQGPLWASGGDRGLYRTSDGGKSWEAVLEVDGDTGVTDVLMDPRNPDVMYAASYQRRRHVWTLINGGPGSGIYKSIDGGRSWDKANKGLPGGDLGRIGLAMSPQDPNVLYATVEAADGKSGFFRSVDRAGSWSRQSDYISSSPQYYQEIVADPHRFDRIYALDTRTRVTEDGGKTWSRLGGEWRHVDDHALWIDPRDEDHLVIGGDGGLYETWDRGANWDYKANLPVTQFYKVAVDNAEPFYNIYGGTQDNNTQGGPSRTITRHGIRNSDWFITVGGDGFDPAVDPEDPNIVYSQWQYGGLVRFDRSTGEQIDIRPQPGPDGPPLRWNWDSALLISPHSPSRLYYGSQILFRSEDRGNTWRPVSGDLTRNMNRNELPVMGRVWSVDAVAKNNSTSFYGTIVALSESPLVEDLLYAGTDDGLIQVSEDGGATWRRIDRLPDVPEMTYVNDLEASWHDPNTVYAVLNNHKRGDFAPYVLVSRDRGRSWDSITGDLPERGSTYTIAEDHEKPDLLFVGTEFGVFASLVGGSSWIQMKGGLPTIAIRDIEIQRREDDLVLSSFGRGFFVLDDYSPLRHLSEDLLPAPGHVFPIRQAWMYVQSGPLGGGEKASQGAAFFTAPNPPFGAVFTYFLGESLRSREQARRKAEKELAKEGEDVLYPSWDALKEEDREESPAVALVVRTPEGDMVRRVEGSTSAGLHRATWDFRYPGFGPIQLDEDGNGPAALPGQYTVTLETRVDGVSRILAGPEPFDVSVLGTPSLPPADREAKLAFQREAGRLQRAVLGASRAAAEAAERIQVIQHAAEITPGVPDGLLDEVRAMELRLTDLRELLDGDRTRSRRSEPAMPGIVSRVQTVVGGQWSNTSAPTGTQREQLEVATGLFGDMVENLRQVVDVDLPALEGRLEEAGVPWTPGRGVPQWP